MKHKGIKKKAGKGKRLIILHAIGLDGLLADLDGNTRRPVDELVWRGDTPHPESKEGLMTAETLWVAQSHTGDYHDNMNSNMFMKCVREKLVPTFKKKYPGKKMVLVADNAPYHHKREIGSLSGLSKAKILELMVKYDVEYLDLSISNDERRKLAEKEGHVDHQDVQDRGDCVRIEFINDEQSKRASLSNPRVGTLEELKIAFVTYLKSEKRTALACKVERYLEDEEHGILWTPPYCPELQPIELFWAVGGNNVALQNTFDDKMKDVVKHLRETFR